MEAMTLMHVLIARACGVHKVALNYLDGLPVGQEKYEFHGNVRKLFETIRAVERLRRKAVNGLRDRTRSIGLPRLPDRGSETVLVNAVNASMWEP